MNDFQLLFFEGYTTVCVNVLYYLPDQKHLVNEFIWTTIDLKPKLPRVTRFIDYWHKEIDAKIKDIIITDISDVYQVQNRFIFDFEK
jgi:uncharacterized protein Usg